MEHRIFDVYFHHSFSPDHVSCQIASLCSAGAAEIQRTEECSIGTHVIPCHKTRTPDAATAGPFGVSPAATKRGGSL
uniref:Uncharacterized protein n=1 Tax=Arundo donax TaxID=35708 RepID=A0A0A9DUC6_ARUDO